MYHIILEITAKNGLKSKVRVTQEEVVTTDDIAYQEKMYLDNWSYPDNVDAVVVNVFCTPEEEE
jgi:hypothetical protein